MAVSENDLRLDRELTQICGLIPLLTLLTPTNVPQARTDFFQGREPQFAYRPLPDLDDLKQQIGKLTSESADDPVIANMAEGLIKNLGLRLQMLANRDTEAFFLISVEMFGHVEADTLELAEKILSETNGTARDRETIGAHEFAEHAEKELDHYRETYPELNAEVNVRSDISGVMVETGNLQIGSETRIAEDRVVPLLQHEVGTHIVTYENGRSQPLHMLSLGVAQYDELQEAMGVMAEFLAGGLLPKRLRVLAYRVVAAHLRSQSLSFRETFEALTEKGCANNTAFSTVMRAYRSGGMTKDAIYLRGLMRLLEHLQNGVDLDTLLVGKISFEAIPLARELMERKVLMEAPLQPRYLELEGADRRLEALRNGLGVLELGDAA